MELSSLEYANLIAWLAQVKYGVRLGKTQLQKLLYIFYGRAISELEAPPFRDDAPKAFPFGPVFPRTYRRSASFPYTPTPEEKAAFVAVPEMMKLATDVVEEFHSFPAFRLSEWSHRDNGPWKKAVYRDGKPAWGREISQDDIQNYFSTPDWRIGL